MNYFLNRKGKKVGLPPGSIVHIGDIRGQELSIDLIEYNKDDFKESEIEFNEMGFGPDDKVTWININGVSDEKFLK